MKYYLKNHDNKLIQWNNQVIEFQCWMDATAFAEALTNIPFLDYTAVVISCDERPLLEREVIDMTGLIPVANGDSVELKEYEE